MNRLVEFAIHNPWGALFLLLTVTIVAMALIRGDHDLKGK